MELPPCTGAVTVRSVFRSVVRAAARRQLCPSTRPNSFSLFPSALARDSALPKQSVAIHTRSNREWPLRNLTHKPSMSSSPGLPIGTFLSSLPWLSKSHLGPQSAQDGTDSCNACTSVSENCFGGEADAHQTIISGAASFHLTDHQQLCFSPVSNATSALSDISAVIGVEQHKIRLVLRTSETAGNVCMTIDQTYLVKPVQTSNHQNVHMIHFSFPYIVLRLQSRATVSADSSDISIASAREQKKFDNVKETVNKLGAGGSSIGVHKINEAGRAQESCSPMPGYEDKQDGRLEWVFMNVISTGAHLLMPKCFPYDMGSESNDDESGENSGGRHVAFVKGCMQQEKAIRDALSQAEGWVHFARRKRRCVEKSPTKNGEQTKRTSELLKMEGIR